MTQAASGSPATRDTGGATAGTYFAGIIMVLIGVLQVLAGIAGLSSDDFFVDVRGYAFDIDPSAWGWVHLILGAFLFLAGLAVFGGKVWAYATALALVPLSLVANFLFIPYYPVWAILLIALDVWVIWALSRSIAARG